MVSAAVLLRTAIPGVPRGPVVKALPEAFAGGSQ